MNWSQTRLINSCSTDNNVVERLVALSGGLRWVTQNCPESAHSLSPISVSTANEGSKFPKQTQSSNNASKSSLPSRQKLFNFRTNLSTSGYVYVKWAICMSHLCLNWTVLFSIQLFESKWSSLSSDFTSKLWIPAMLQGNSQQQTGVLRNDQLEATVCVNAFSCYILYIDNLFYKLTSL